MKRRNTIGLWLESLEQRVLLNGDTPLLASQVAALKSGLNSVSAWADSLDNFGTMAQQLPFVGDNLGDVLDIGGRIQTELVNPAVAFLDGVDPTPNELRALLDSLSETIGPVNCVLDADELSYTLQFVDGRSKLVTMDLGSNALGFSADPVPTVSFDTTLDLSFTFGLDLTPGLSAAESYFIRVDTLTASGSVAASGLGFDAQIGFLGASVSGGTANLSADVAVTLNDPNSDGKITISELVGTSLPSLVGFAPTSSLDVDLPVAASVGSYSLSGTIHIDDANLFDPTAPSVTQTGLDEGLNFNRLTPKDLLAAITSLRSKFEAVRNSSLFNTAIPFTSAQTLGSVLNLDSVFENELIARIAASATPNFASVQDLADKLSDILGTPVGYDPATDELTIDLQFSHSFSPSSVPVNLNLELGTLGEISASSPITLAASAALGFKIIIDLTPPGSGDYFITNNLFIEDASVAGDVTLMAPDIDATARFGFLGIQITDGTASAHLAAGLELHKPGQPGNKRISLGELTGAVLSDPGSLGSLVVTGDATLDFPNIGVLNNVIPISGQPSVRFDFPNVTALSSFTPTFTDFGDLFHFENVGFGDIVNALKGVKDYLATLSDFSFLSFKLPLVGKSVSELVDYVGEFGDFLTSLESGAPADSLQAVASKLETALGVPPGTVVLSMDGDALRIELSLGAAYDSGPVPFNLDLAALAGGNPLLDGITQFIDVGGSGMVDVAAAATLALHLGIDLSTPATPSPFLYDSTQLELTARLSGTNLDFSVALGPLGVFVKNGHATLDADGDPGTSDPAAFTVAIVDDPVDHRYLLGDLSTGIVSVGLVGAAEVYLPLFFPTSSAPFGGSAADGADADDVPDNVLKISVGSLDDIGGTTALVTPDIAGAFASADLLTQLGVVIDGLDLLLKTLQNALEGRVFGVQIPLIGDKLKEGARFIEDMRTNVVAKLKAAPDQTLESVQRAIFDSLGPGGLDILTLIPTFHDSNADNDGNNTTSPDTVPDYRDVPFDLTSDAIKFLLEIHKTQELLTSKFGFDIGFPGLGLKADPNSTVVIELGFDFQFGFGVSKTDGFFFDTSAASELAVELRLRIPDMDIRGSLGFLTLEFKDEDADGDEANNNPSLPNYDADGDARLPSKVEGSFTIDLKDPNNDGRLTFSEMSSSGLDLSDVVAATISAIVDINLDARVSFGGSAVFPSLVTEFDLEWSISGSTDADSESFGGATSPYVAFNNVQLDLGSFFSDFAKPILDRVNDIISPIRPVLDVLNARLPVFSDVGPLHDIVVAAGGDTDPPDEISLLDLAKAFGTVSPQIGAIASAIEVINLIDKISQQAAKMGGSDNIFIPLGSFDFGAGSDIRSSGFSLSGVNPNVTDIAGKAVDYLSGLVGDEVAQEAAGLIEQFAGDKIGGASNPLSFPLLDDPTLAFKLLLGKPVELFVFDMPPLAVDFSLDVFFPILGPLGVQLTGGLSAKLDLLFGYDTRGLQLFASDDFEHPEQIFYGFYVSDTASFDGSGPDIPEAVLKASIEAFAAVNVVIASAGVGGGLFAKIEGNLNDPDADGKVYLDELIDNLPFCIFDISGQLTVGLTAFLKIGIGFLSYTKHFDIATATLVDFNYSCDIPELAKVEGGVLKLNMGPRAGNRLSGDQDEAADQDGDEIFKVTHKSGSAGSETVTVSAYGYTQEYSGFTKIEGEGGAGHDTITLVGVLTGTELWGDFRAGETASDGNDIIQATGTNVGPVTIHGGGGIDELVGGDNHDNIDGGSGNDTVQGNGGNDTLRGGGGNDTVNGGEGADSLYGDGEDDVLVGGQGKDHVEGGAGNDNLSGDEENDTLLGDAGIDSLFGGDGDDELHGGADNDELHGELHNDKLFGDAGNDTLDGDDGDDELHGGADHDTLRGSTGADKLYGDAGNDTLLGGTENDELYGGDDQDTLRGEQGNDTLEGNSGHDLLYGGIGNDTLIGGGSDPANLPDGNDTLYGEEGDDVLLGDNARIGSVILIGGIGNDLIFGGSGRDLMYGQGGNDTLEGGTDNDTIYGNAGDDVLRGQEDDDDMQGGADNDTLLGGVGHDVMIGGASDVVNGLDGADSLVGDSGDDRLLGDNGTVNRVAGTVVTNPGGGAGRDTVFGGIGDDVIFGGGGGDLLVGDAADGTGRDLIVGDQGTRSDVSYVAAHSAVAGSSGNDTIFGSGGDDTLLGGDADDLITGDDGLDVVFGDNATITLVGGGIGRLTTTDPTHGGHDTITGSQGDDTIFGGKGNDDISGGIGHDIILGDNGTVVLADGSAEANDIFTTDPGDGGKDTITGADGDDTILGGSGDGDLHNLGGDSLSGGGGSDIIIADNGYVTRDASNVVLRIETTLTNFGGDDVAFGDGGGSDTMFGGFGDDSLVGGEMGDIIFGDNGVVVRNDRSPEANDVFSNAPDDGGQDTILGAGSDDILIGGTDADTILGGVGSDVILGDHAYITRNASDAILRISTHFPVNGGNDSIEGDDGADTVFGGFGDDLIHGGNDGASDVLFGDNGVAVRADGTSQANDLYSSDPDLGGRDTIYGGAGDDTLIGGSGDPDTTGTGGDSLSGDAGRDILIGDNAYIRRNVDDIVENIQTSFPNFGGDDTAFGGTGNDTILGGFGLDSLDGEAGDDILLGDNGELEYAAVGLLDTLDFITTTHPTLGHDDTIIGGSGSDITFGGTEDDLIEGNSEADILVGDHGRIELLNNVITLIRTIDPALGGRDTIAGNDGDDILLGGFEGDTLRGGTGDDILLGDNGRLEWRSDGRLSDIVGISVAANNPALFGWFTDALGNPIVDSGPTTLDLVTTTDPTLGGRDLIYGDDGKDFAAGGNNSDTIYGDDGNGTGDVGNRDILFGDHGRIYPQFSTLTGFNARNFFAIDIGLAAGGEGDRMWGEEGDDVMLGQQGDDRMFGGSGDDDMIGGHNASGGYDELITPAIIATSNLPVNDLMDGGSGDDVMAGDNAIVWRRGDDLSPRFRLLTTGTIYTTTDETITANVALASQSDPDDAVGRDIQLVDHSDSVQANPLGRFGADVMAGGADSDVMFGELGNDLMQSDGSIGADDANPSSITLRVGVTDSGSNPDTDEDLYFNIPETATDGDDYMEGNGGNDLMYGGLGQDDLVGGSSALFGLDDADPVLANALRPDGSDTIFGGAGTDISRNDPGDANVNLTTQVITTVATGHARDADYIMGDNANVYRLVGAGDLFKAFSYDNYTNALPLAQQLKIVPRAMTQLDYTLGGADFAGGNYTDGAANADNGSADLIHGESGDDVIFGMTGSDVIFGEGQDDDIVGGYGDDWISGGTGQDGVVGDDGLVSTSRNGTAESLYGIAATTPQTISTPGSMQIALINATGDLKKTIDLTPFSYDSGWNATDDEFPDNADAAPFADDIIFGGLGGDFLHGGSGDDAISGAEALAHAYVPVYDTSGNPIGVRDLGYTAVGMSGQVNPGDVLAFNTLDVDGRHQNNRDRPGEFPLYDEYEPLRKVLLTDKGALSKAESVYEFLLNFNMAEGVLRPGGTTAGNQNQSVTYGPVHDDGNDAIFGDLGNDWLVGGTGRDNLYGGWGNDLINADDDQATHGGLNDVPDTHPTYEDRAYGGAGRDVLIANTGGDRLIDWVGEYNSYLVPFAPFGMATVSRTLQPALPEFLYALSKADGADPTRAADTGSDPLRNGEPAGELGLVLQKDFAWRAQTGPPADPQAGNIPGGKRDVQRSADFNNGTMAGFAPDSGTWAVSGGALQVSATSLHQDAASVFYVDSYLPAYFEVQASVKVLKPTAGWNANAYVLFDYESPVDFKFAGINVANNKFEMGHRTVSGWIVDVQSNIIAKPDTFYNLLVAVNGTAVTVQVDGAKSFSHTFAPRIIDGLSYGINRGMVGVGSNNSRGSFDNVAVQVVPPQVTYQNTEDFSDGIANLFTGMSSGTWKVQDGRSTGSPVASTGLGINLIDLGIGRGLQANSALDLSTAVNTPSIGGIAFDAYSPTDFKFVTIDAPSDQVVIGHYTARGGWVKDAIVSRTIDAGKSYTLALTLRGSTVSVTLNGLLATSFAFNSVTLDGAFGLVTKGGTSSFDDVVVKTNDPAMANHLLASTTRVGAASGDALTTSALRPITVEAIARWVAAPGTQGNLAALLRSVDFEIADLPGRALAEIVGDRVLIDMDAGGIGWFIDTTPDDDREFVLDAAGALVAVPGGPAAGLMDLLTVVTHELGHVLGFGDLDSGLNTDDLMAGELAAGTRRSPASIGTTRTAVASWAGGTNAKLPAPKPVIVAPAPSAQPASPAISGLETAWSASVPKNSTRPSLVPSAKLVDAVFVAIPDQLTWSLDDLGGVREPLEGEVPFRLRRRRV